MSFADRLSSTLKTVYAAAADPLLWQAALRQMEDLTGSAGAVLGFVPKRAEDIGFNLAGRFTSEQCATYTREYQAICPRTKHMVTHPEVEVQYDALLITETEMDRDPVYAWFGQHNLRYFVGSRLPDTELYVPVFTLQRSPVQGHVQALDLELFALIKPHVAQALTLADRLGTLGTAWQVGRALLEQVAYAVFTLDEYGYVLFFNRAAEELLVEGDGLKIENGKLVAVHSTCQRRLEALIDSAVGSIPSVGRAWMRIERTSGKPPYAALIAPVTDERFHFTDARAATMVLVSDPHRPINPDPIALRAVFGLTEAESRLALAIAAGHDLTSASAALEISLETARSHLKAIFRKMGAARQQEVVSRLSWLQLH